MALTKITSPVEYIEKSFLKKLLQDKDVTDISYNGECFYVLSTEGGRKRVELKANPEQVNAFLRQLANLSERRWNYSDPILDVSFGRYRLNAVFPSLGRVHNRKRPTFSLRLESDFCRLDNDPGFFPEGAMDILYRALEQKEAIVIGGKTGTTDQAGNCVILYDKSSDGTPYISVIMGASDKTLLYDQMNQLFSAGMNKG